MYLDDCIKKSSELTSTFKLFLHTLSSYADHQGFCWPSEREISLAMSMSISTVKRCIREAVELRFLEVKRRWKRSNKYRLLCLKEVKLSTMGPCDEPREQPPFVQKRLTAKVVKSSWKSPREIQIILEDATEVLGEAVVTRNKGWLWKIAQAVEESWIYEALSWVREAIQIGESTGDYIEKPCALLTWRLRTMGAQI